MDTTGNTPALNARELARYIGRLEAEFGAVEGDPDLSFGPDAG
ncbi:hypothetical protein [Nocardia sp. R7R-8]